MPNQPGFELASSTLRNIKIHGEEIDRTIINRIAGLCVEMDHVNAHAIGILGTVLEMAQTNVVADFMKVLVILDYKVHTNHLTSESSSIWEATNKFTTAYAADTSPDHIVWKGLVAQSIDEAYNLQAK